MLLERRTVSRKTPNDGKLEISPAAAAVIAARGAPITVACSGSEAAGTIVAMRCSCAKGNGSHEHVFLESDLFRTLEAGTEVDLLVGDASSRVSVTPVR